MTTNENSYREKGRAVFLAALMVLSVVAMSTAFVGGAAANDAPEETTWDGVNTDGPYWQGQSLNVSGVNETNTGVTNPFEVDIVRGSPAQETGDVLVSGIEITDEKIELTEEQTSELDTRVHFEVIGDDDINQSSSFVFNAQEVDFEFEPSSTAVQGDTVDLNFTDDDDRGDTHNVTITSNDLDDDTLGDVWNETSDNGEVTYENVHVDDPAFANISTEDLDIGEYEFDININNSTATDTVTLNVVDEIEAGATFAEDDHEQVLGDVMAIDIDIEGASNVDNTTLNLSNDYEAGVEIDTSGLTEDQTVTLYWNTYNTSFNAVDEDGDSLGISTSENHNLDELELPATLYSANLYVNDDLQNRMDTTSLSVSEPGEVGDITNWVVAEGTALDEIDDIAENAFESDEVAQNDLLVQTIEAEGVFGQAWDNDSYNDDAVVEGDNGIYLNFTSQYDPSEFAEPDQFNQSDDIEFFLNPEDGLIYAVTDTADIADEVNEDSLDHAWDVEFHIDTDEYESSHEDVGESEFEIVDAVIELNPFVEEPYYVTPDDEAVLEGVSTQAPGTEFELELNKDGVFGQTHDIEVVHEDGEFRWSTDGLDFSERSVGEQFEIESDAFQNSSLHGTTVNAEFSDTPERNTMTDMGALADLLGVEEGEIMGAVEDLLDENEDLQTQIDDLNDDLADLQSTLDDAEADRDAAEDEAADLQSQLDDAESALDDAESALTDAEADRDAAEDEAADLQSQVDELNDEISQLEDDLEEAESSDDSSDDDGTPGFGIAVAITALIGAAMLALRRQD